MKVVEIDEIPENIIRMGSLCEPIYDSRHNVVGFIKRGERKAYVKRGFKVSAQDLIYQDESD
ncbi:MAG TPA: hypothetical protein VIH69_01830 [Dehalococcoidia bacterium]